MLLKWIDLDKYRLNKPLLLLILLSHDASTDGDDDVERKNAQKSTDYANISNFFKHFSSSFFFSTAVGILIDKNQIGEFNTEYNKK